MYGFKELMVLPVEAGEDELIKYRRMKHRKTDTTSESTDWVCGECNCEPCTCGEINEDAPATNTGSVVGAGDNPTGTVVVDKRRRKDKQPKLLKRFRRFIDSDA